MLTIQRWVPEPGKIFIPGLLPLLGKKSIRIVKIQFVDPIKPNMPQEN